MSASTGTSGAALRGRLLVRREKLRRAIARAGEAADLHRLLDDVDGALDRVANGTHGECVVCHEQVAERDLLANPLIRYCLCDLSPTQQRALEDDLGLATQIQTALLPLPDQTIGDWDVHYRYVPHGAVSGDTCDIFARPGGDELFFVFGDVSGKGVAAALLMAHLNAAFRTLLDLDLTPKELVERADRVFSRSTISSQFATLVCGRAGAGGEIEICNAGHWPPFVLRGTTIEPVAATGLPVGVFGGRPYTTRTINLDPGDALFLYTDGLTEARDPGGEEYGEDRLTRLLEAHVDRAPRALADACLEDLARFERGAARGDDLSLMVLRRG